jgi:hypothetical protein
MRITEFTNVFLLQPILVTAPQRFRCLIRPDFLIKKVPPPFTTTTTYPVPLNSDPRERGRGGGMHLSMYVSNFACNVVTMLLETNKYI